MTAIIHALEDGDKRRGRKMPCAMVSPGLTRICPKIQVNELDGGHQSLAIGGRQSG